MSTKGKQTVTDPLKVTEMNPGEFLKHQESLKAKAAKANKRKQSSKPTAGKGKNGGFQETPETEGSSAKRNPQAPGGT